jgi:hypothetical protein
MTESIEASAVLKGLEIEMFKTQFHGELLSRTDDGYYAARHVFNAMVEHYPALIARYRRH